AAVTQVVLLPVPASFTIRLTPRSPLFPYTTLFRSSRPRPTTLIIQIAPMNSVMRSRFFSATLDPARLDWVPPPNSEDKPPPRPRSEEHTSELQSRENLVCRLLLEKKNSTPATTYSR